MIEGRDVEEVDADLRVRPGLIEGGIDRRKSNVSSANVEDDEIDLWALWLVLWKGRYVIAISSVVITSLAVLIAVLSPNMYTSEVVLAPAANEMQGGLSNLGAQFGGLASLAGISLQDGSSNKIAQASAVIVSWPFLSAFVQEEKIKPDVVAAKGWDSESNVIKYASSMYNAESRLWVTDGVESKEPSSWETYEVLRGMINVSMDERAGLFTISVEHVSPVVAKNIAEKLAQKINHYYQVQDVTLAANSIAFLEGKISQTSVSEFKTVFYNMIEQQTKTLMLAEASEEYLLRTIVPAVVPEEKSAPNRKIIILLGGVVGMMIGIMIVLVRSVYESKVQVKSA